MAKSPVRDIRAKLTLMFVPLTISLYLSASCLLTGDVGRVPEVVQRTRGAIGVPLCDKGLSHDGSAFIARCLFGSVSHEEAIGHPVLSGCAMLAQVAQCLLTRRGLRRRRRTSFRQRPSESAEVLPG